MEQDKRVATMGGTFLDTAIQNIEEMKVVAQMILDSRLAPDHFYEKKPDGKPDYTKGNLGAVILIAAHGWKLGLDALISLQHIIQVNGVLSIKGDAAKTLIFRSGKLKPGSWKETVSGNIKDGTYECTITAERTDTKEVMSRTFSIDHAKRAGLWIDDAKVKGADGWKYIKSAWYKYPERMMAYRALGFLSRDLFPDVLHGSYTTEEAMDIPQDTSLVVQTPGGTEIIVPDPDFNKVRSENLTSKANDQIDKRAGDLEPPAPDLNKYPTAVGDAYPVKQDDPPQEDKDRESIATMLNGTPGFIPVYTEEEMMQLDAASELNPMVECDSLMVKARDADPMKNTNKKLRSILLAHYTPVSAPTDEVIKPEEDGSPPLYNQAGDVITDQEEVPGPTPEPDPEQEQAEFEPVGDEPPVDNAPVEPNTSFDTAEQTPTVVDGNKFDINVVELVDGKRPFDETKTLFEALANVAGVDNTAYESMVKTKFPQFQKYRTKEDFCYQGEVSEINTLLNSI